MIMPVLRGVLCRGGGGEGSMLWYVHGTLQHGTLEGVPLAASVCIGLALRLPSPGQPGACMVCACMVSLVSQAMLKGGISLLPARGMHTSAASSVHHAASCEHVGSSAASCNAASECTWHADYVTCVLLAQSVADSLECVWLGPLYECVWLGPLYVGRSAGSLSAASRSPAGAVITVPSPYSPDHAVVTGSRAEWLSSSGLRAGRVMAADYRKRLPR